MRCSGDARRNCERAQAEVELLSMRADQLAGGRDLQGESADPVGSVLCRSCWQAAIVYERKTGVSRLRGYRRRHPNGAEKQCGGRTWW